MTSLQFAVTPKIKEVLNIIKQSSKSQSSNQSNIQSKGQSNNRSNNQSFNQLRESGLLADNVEKITLEQAQLIVKAFNSLDPHVSKLVNQSTNQSTDQSVNQSVKSDETADQTSQSSQSHNQSNRLSNTQSISQSINRPLSVHKLLEKSALLPVEEAPKKPRDPEFLAFLERMRHQQERREIAMLSKPINASINELNQTTSASKGVGAEHRELGHGVNILTLMGTGFAVFYYAGTMLFPHSPLGPILMGLVGLIGALLMEVSLLLIREGKRESFEAHNQSQNQPTNILTDPKAFNQTVTESQQYEQRRKEKEQAMMRAMEEMKQSNKHLSIEKPSNNPANKPVKANKQASK
jgi:hypothetical protein